MSHPRYALIGLPTSGKTSVGKEFAKRASFDFIDFVPLLEERVCEEKGSLLDLIYAYPNVYRDFASFNILKYMRKESVVFAFPSYSIYWDDLMQEIKKRAKIVALKISFNTWLNRLEHSVEYPLRELKEGKALPDIYRDRWQQCIKYADYLIRSETPQIASEDINKIITI